MLAGDSDDDEESALKPSALAAPDQLPRQQLPFWVALALSVATVGPTLAMAGNGQGLIATVGKAVPLVFVIGLIGVALVGYSFLRLTRYLNHAGSAYALAGGTVGPRVGFFSGFAMPGSLRWLLDRHPGVDRCLRQCLRRRAAAR